MVITTLQQSWWGITWLPSLRARKLFRQNFHIVVLTFILHSSQSQQKPWVSWRNFDKSYIDLNTKSYIMYTFYLFRVCMQQIPEWWEHHTSTPWNPSFDEEVKRVQYELDMLFTRHEEVRAKRTFTAQTHALRLGFAWLVYFSKEEEKAALSLGVMYTPLLTSILLHRPVWKIRKAICLYKYRKNIDLHTIQDPRDEQ